MNNSASKRKENFTLIQKKEEGYHSSLFKHSGNPEINSKAFNLQKYRHFKCTSTVWKTIFNKEHYN